jgi:uncharacterized protein (DUF697 family)
MGLGNYLKRILTPGDGVVDLEQRLRKLKEQTPAPVFWLFGKTQSGKTSIIKYLTGADEAEIGAGFRPTTRFSRMYQFPTAEAPLLTFLDTRGLDEPGYDAGEDIARFNEQAHVVVVTARVMDHAQERVLAHLGRIRDAEPHRPFVLVLTCLHEAYPQQQHTLPYPFGTVEEPDRVPEGLRRSLAEQRERFRGFTDRVVAVDLTKPEEGFNEPNYGGEALTHALVEVLPSAYRQTLLTVDRLTHDLRGWHERRALPYILGYSSLAATAGAFPIPWVDLFILPGIQTKMIHHLARLYGQPLSGRRFLEIASTLGLGLLVRQAIREVAKVIPGLGSVLGGALAASSTFALGKAFCFYYSAILSGHVPRPEELRAYYNEQLTQAQQFWKTIQKQAAQPGVRNQESGVRSQMQSAPSDPDPP